MKSTLKIALGCLNEPVINLSAIATDDIRDQLCRQFIERLGHESNLAFVEFGYQSITLPDPVCNVSIQPIHPDELGRYINRLSLKLVKDIIPLAFQMFGHVDRDMILSELTKLDNDLGKETVVHSHKDQLV